MVSERMYRLTVFLEMPKRREISLSEIWSRMCQRRIIPIKATSITPNSYLNVEVGLCRKCGSTLRAKILPKWVKFRRKSTLKFPECLKLGRHVQARRQKSTDIRVVPVYSRQ